MARLPTRVSYVWTQKKPSSPTHPKDSPSVAAARLPNNLFANTLSILALTVSGLSAWYTVDSEKRIATESIRSQHRAILYVGNEFGVSANDEQNELQLRFSLNNSGQTSAKNVIVRYATYSDKPNDLGRPPHGWPPPQTIRVRQVETSIPVNVPVPDQSLGDIQDIIFGRKALWVDIGVVYEDEWGSRYETTKCFAISRVKDSASGQICSE